MQLDLNCDLGEGCAYDQELLSLITSANVACGGHAGDAATAFATLHAALLRGVRVGEHPGFVDRRTSAARNSNAANNKFTRTAFSKWVRWLAWLWRSDYHSDT